MLLRMTKPNLVRDVAFSWLYPASVINRRTSEQPVLFSQALVHYLYPRDSRDGRAISILCGAPVENERNPERGS